LGRAPPRTREGEFVFLVDLGDPSFIRPPEFTRILQYCENYPDRDFLLQSKNPVFFAQFNIPKNVIIGTTLETDIDEIVCAISKAPPPSQRAEAMWGMRVQRKMVTAEPIMKFNLETFSRTIESSGRGASTWGTTATRGRTASRSRPWPRRTPSWKS
jgi:hypothetical protein